MQERSNIQLPAHTVIVQCVHDRGDSEPGRARVLNKPVHPESLPARVEDTTGWSIRKFVKTVRRYRTIQIQAGDHTITAADPSPEDAHTALEAIRTPSQRGTKLSQLGSQRSWSIEAEGKRKRTDAQAFTPDPGQEFIRRAGRIVGFAAAIHVRWYRRDGSPDAYEGTATVSGWRKGRWPRGVG